jgi:hypothetical protein
MRRDIGKAMAAGLHCRPLEETVRAAQRSYRDTQRFHPWRTTPGKDSPCAGVPRCRGPR